ncbi:MAG: hypothetical protein F6K13_04355 [Okeania sp. SIO2B9]|nr:hypothetical protein [Okeania sp. SIO2B9]
MDTSSPLILFLLVFYSVLPHQLSFIILEEGDRRQETGDRRKITYGFAPPSNA